MKEDKTQTTAAPKQSFIKRRFNLKKWMGFDLVKSNTETLKESAHKLFIPEFGIASESLDNAMARLGLSEQEIETKKKSLLRLALFMVLITILVFCYCGYQLDHGHYRAVIVSFIVGLVSLAFAFRYHFWYFQLKERKLGCSIKEWFMQGLLGVKS